MVGPLVLSSEATVMFFWVKMDTWYIEKIMADLRKTHKRRVQKVNSPPQRAYNIYILFSMVALSE